MMWIKRHAALTALMLVALVAAVLFITGRLQFHKNGNQQRADNEKITDSDGTSAPNESRIQGNKVVLDQDAFQASGIRTTPVGTGSLPVFFEAPGEVQLAEDRIAHVTPQISGVVLAVYKGVGDRVAKGSPLCLIESVELGDAKASYVAAHAETELAQKNYERWKQLYDKGLRTQNELIAAEADFTRAKLKMEAAVSRLRGLGIGPEEIQSLSRDGAGAVSNRYTLRSPIAGSVLQRTATAGQGVTAADQIFFVADLSEVWVQAVAREQDLPAMRVGAPAVVRVSNMPEASLRGRVTYIGQQVDEKTRTVPLRVVVRNSARATGLQGEFLLRPGLFTNIQIETSRRKDALIIPFVAVQTDGSESYVFVRSTAPPTTLTSKPGSNGEGKTEKNSPVAAFERRGVQLGTRDGRMVEVIKGLRAGEQIAVENAYLLKGELEKSKIED